MTRAHIEVVVTMSLEDAESLRRHLNITTESDTGDPQMARVIDVYNGLNRVLDQAETVLA